MVGPPPEEEVGSQEPLAGGLGDWRAHLGIPGLRWAQGPSCRRGGAGGEGPAELRAFWPARGCFGNNDAPPPYPGSSWGFQGGLNQD